MPLQRLLLAKLSIDSPQVVAELSARLERKRHDRRSIAELIISLLPLFSEL